MTNIATRDGYGKKLAQLDDERIVVLAADLAESSRVNEFAKKHPERFIQVGISEQDMFGMADGLALEGKIPITNTFAAFCMRAHEQIRMICFNKANVKIAGHHSGISVGPDGETQQCIEDISLFRTLPYMTVVVPSDAIEAAKALDAITTMNGPCYLRLSREPFPIITDENTNFQIGKAEILKEGNDVLIVACGTMVSQALIAAQMLENQHVSACVMNMHTIKPLDTEKLLAYAKKTGAVITAEEHSIYGGLGSAVCEALSLSKIPVKVLGINDIYAESGSPQELFEKFGLSPENIVSYCHDILRFKEENYSLPHKHTIPQNKTREEGFVDVKEIIPDKVNSQDPRGRIMKMSEHDKKKVDDVLGKMFGSRKN